MSTNPSLWRAFLSALREPYAWPGGYAVRIILSDGGTICHQCARANARIIASATRDRDRDRSGWAFAGAEVQWEGPADYCVQCGAELPTEYGDPDSSES